jgi:hypothetical protein
MALSPFAGPRSKVARATRHIQETEAILEAFGQSDLATFVVDTETKPGATLLGVEIAGGPPIDIPLAIGDAIHNLRASLDFLAYELMSASGTIDEQMRFPFYKEEDNLRKQVGKSGLLKNCGPDVARLIVDGVKPYKDGNYDLWAMNKLDNIDKHRLIVPVFVATDVYGISGVDESGWRLKNNTKSIVGSGFFPYVELGTNFKLDHPPFVACSVYFREGQYFDGRDVIPTLQTLAQKVTDVIEAFEVLGVGPPLGLVAPQR